MRAIFNEADVETADIISTGNHSFTMVARSRYMLTSGNGGNNASIKIPVGATNIVRWSPQNEPLVFFAQAGQTTMNVLNNFGSTVKFSLTKLS